ncbi:MAG TPA: hypothetical protein VJV79_11165 [Polyangiaceae bacterium]|nr:hypothetical protein [Polyangiaceae bacterium]
MYRRMLVALFVLAAACGSVDETETPVLTQRALLEEEPTPLSAMFRPGVSTPFDLLYVERSSGGPAEYYLPQLKLTSETEGVVSVANAKTGVVARSFALNANRAGLQPLAGGAVDPELDALVLSNYSEWCGKWHNGVRKQWQFCGGSSCSGEGSVRWCIRTRPKPSSH